MRLTKRNGKFVFINTEAIPRSSCKGEYGFMPCQFMRSCRNVATRQCPILKILDRLADLEDKEENATDVKSEVAREIFEEIDTLIVRRMIAGCHFIDDRLITDIAELKKKYTEKGE